MVGVGEFRTQLGHNIFYQKYAHSGADTWAAMCERLIEDVCGGKVPLLYTTFQKDLVEYIKQKKFIPGGRYLYYAGRPLHAWNNCYLLKGEEDTREEWGNLLKRSSDCLMNGGGIGTDYSVFRPSGATLGRTGGIASGPIPLMKSVNEVGRNVMQGGSRRSAIYASLNWQHGDAGAFLTMKDWHSMPIGTSGLSVWDAKQQDFNYPAPLDMTNVSLNYDDAWLNTEERHLHPIFLKNVEQALSTGEPGFSFNFGAKQNETLRNACWSYESKLLTDRGYYSIGDLVGQSVNIWNGEQWSAVVPYSTGINELVRVHLSDGSYHDVTPYHKFLVVEGFDNTKVERVEACSLQEGDKLQKWAMPTVYCERTVNPQTDAYSQGFYSGDGNKDYEYSYLYYTKYMCENRLNGKCLPDTDVRRRWKHGPMLDKNFVPVNADIAYKLNWLAGILDSDGTVTRDANGNGLQITAIDKEFLLNIRLMLSTLGCRAKVVSGCSEGMRALPDGKGGSKEYLCQKGYRLLVGNTDTLALMQNGLHCSRLILHSTPPQRDARQYVKVLSVETLGRKEETFCVTEPLLNQMAVGGIVTGNCCEVVSEDDGDVCNLGSINMAAVETLDEFKAIVELASMFLVCGTVRADLPFEKVYRVREKNRRLGLGLMGMHEWLLKRGYGYEVVDELKQWLAVYEEHSEKAAIALCDVLGISRPVAFRAIAPTGTIGIMAGTTTGIEPLFAVAYKRRYLKNGTRWHYEYAVDATADLMIKEYGVDPEKIQTAYSMSSNPEARIKFQADVQDYVDMAISSTINMPAWGSKLNNEDGVTTFASTLSRYAHRLRGFTCYPDGSRGGQPITEVPYAEAAANKGVVFEENQDKQCSSGVCGI